MYKPIPSTTFKGVVFAIIKFSTLAAKFCICQKLGADSLDFLCEISPLHTQRTGEESRVFHVPDQR